ncbi:MAG: hypothetical protein GIX03_12920 [Candidatus Eremiobacteraeota bacterium]|nr:hypothetical protein [Candidatus Eremiobacteraeota bacterium]MBC5803867.1 hypothetical protein [Candidatus Eremiobacteraeota bacterium]MBC5822975.1 hypothetical protein [Candidatus Eremiobacteraeota bacterium]
MHRLFSLLVLACAAFLAATPVLATGESFAIAVPLLEKAPSLAGTLDDSWA